MDLVEGGDVRRLFSDEELLKIVAAEEEHERRTMTGTHNQGYLGNVHHTSGQAAEDTGDGGRVLPTEQAPAFGEDGNGGPGSPTASKDEVSFEPCCCMLYASYNIRSTLRSTSLARPTP